MKKHKINHSFNGTLDEYHKIREEFISNKIIEDLIKILELPSCTETKENLHQRIFMAMFISSKPSQTEAETTQTDITRLLKSYSESIKKAHTILVNMHYSYIESDKFPDKHKIAAEKIRIASKTISKEIAVYATGSANSYHRLYNTWPEFYNFDSTLNACLPELKKIISFIDSALETGIKSKNTDKDKDNYLIYLLCEVYKDFMGNFSIPNKKPPRNHNDLDDNYTHDNILKMLKLILPHTYYDGEINDEALSKRIRRLKKYKKYSKLFT